MNGIIIYKSCIIDTAFCAALFILVSYGIPFSSRIFCPSSSFVPVSLMTIGTLCSVSLYRFTTVFATLFALVIPPSTFMNIILAFGFCSTSFIALVMFSSVAPPPTSRNVAGFLHSIL